MYDVIIVGGGPAGLSAALVLGRCRRRVLVCDAGEPRNAPSKALHGYLTRDGIDPAEFLRIGRDELRRYPNVEFLRCAVATVERGDRSFTAICEDGSQHTARILLLATGVVDELPKLPGIEQFYGRSVHLCPYCDGWEHRDESLAAYGEGTAGLEMAIELRRWSDEVTLCTNGPAQFSEQDRQRLAHANVRMREERIERLEGEGDALRAVRFTSGEPLACTGLFFSAEQKQRCNLAFSLGCAATEEGRLESCETQATNIPGVYAIGNAAPGLQLVIMAAASGTQAAFSINERLHEVDISPPE